MKAASIGGATRFPKTRCSQTSQYYLRKIYENKVPKRKIRCGPLNVGRGDIMQLRELGQGQVWWHTPEQRVAAFTFRRYTFGLRLAVAQVDARPAMPISSR